MPWTLLFHFGPYIAMAVMGLGVFGLWEMHKVDAAKHENDQAVIQQNLKDRASSEKQIGILQTKLENLDGKTQPIIQRIVAAPVTAGCGPSVGVAVDGLRELFDGSGKPPGPVAAKPTGMPTPLGPTRNIK